MENLVNVEYLKSHFSNKRVFITGHTGFKGAWLTALVHDIGAKVKGYALEPQYENGLFSLLKSLHIIDSVIGDIRDSARLTTEIINFQPDYIFHLAAQPLVRRSYEMPAETFAINVVGTANVLEAVNKLPGKCTIIVITTDKVYDNQEQNLLYKEDDKLGGYDPYSSSKACAELAVSSFRSSFFNISNISFHQKAVATARAGNVIGGGDWNQDRIIPDIILSLMAKRPIELRNPLAVRPWQHVLEPLGGYLLLAASLSENPNNFSKPYNFGPLPDDHLTVQQLAETAIAVWGDGAWKDVSKAGQLHEAHLLKLNISRAVTELHWKPKLNAVEAIEWTIHWYREPLLKKLDCCFQQIKEYLAL